MSGMRDEYGNPVRQTDEYGNSVRETHGGTMGSYGATGIDPTSGYGNRGTGTDGRVGGFGGGGHGAGHAGGGHIQEHRVGGGGTGPGGMLQRSGSSSSSDDDGQGGRRKKGMAQKIKDKISGVGGKERDPRHTGTRGQNTTYGPSHEDQYYGQEGYEKKGTMEKIKEKIPGVGGKQKDPHHAHTNQPMGQETTYGQHNQQYYGTESHEKKGIMEKIKEGVAGKEKDPRHTPNKTLGHQPMGQQATHGQHHEEHYGQEGREKKGIMEKIKEKIPGGGHSRDV